MSTVKTSTTVPVPAEKVWEAIGNFNALPEWHPGVEKSTLEDGGKVRRLKLLNGAELVERLEQHDDDEYTYTYSVVAGPLPVMNYSSTIKVRPTEDGGAEIEWSGDFEPVGAAAEAAKTIQNVYESGLENLQKMFSGK